MRRDRDDGQHLADQHGHQRPEAPARQVGEEVREAPAERREEAVDHAGGFASANASTATAPRGPTSSGLASSDVIRCRRSCVARAIASTALATRAQIVLVGVQPAPLRLRLDVGAGLLGGQRRGDEGRVPRLGERAAGPDRDRRAELLVDDRADQHLVPVHHLLDQHLGRLRAAAARRRQHVGGCRPRPRRCRAVPAARRRAAPCAGSRARAPSPPPGLGSSRPRRPPWPASSTTASFGRRTP